MESVIDQAFAAALYTEGDAGLDTGASLLAAAPQADAELVRRGEEFVRRAWRRGWLPADVVRLVRRDLDEHAAGLAAGLIASEVRRYDELPPRWRSQLDDLPAAPPAGRPDRFSYASAFLALCRLLLALPAIEPVGPPPGAAREALTRPPVVGEPRMLTRIRALLAKAEATGYPEEAEALTTKAQELMARHSIDEALLAARTHGDRTPGACRIGVDAPTRRPRRSCSTRWPRRTAARPCGTATWASPRSSASRRTSRPSNCSTPRCSSRARPR